MVKIGPSNDNGVFLPGDRVVMTGRALHAMGARVGADVARVWIVRACGCDLCRNGRHVSTDQACAIGDGWRHIAIAALRHVGEPCADELPAPELAPGRMLQ